MTEKDIEKLAKLSRLDLTLKEKETFAAELDSILLYVDQIREVVTEDTSDIPQVGHGDVYNILRSDEVANTNYANKIKDEFPEKDGDYLKVKQIL